MYYENGKPLGLPPGIVRRGSSGDKNGRGETPFQRVARQSLFERVSAEYDAAIDAGTPLSTISARFGCVNQSTGLWFKSRYAPPYNKVKPEARDSVFRTYMFASPTELVVRLERGRYDHVFPQEGETLELYPQGSGYAIYVLVEAVQLPPRKNPKTAILLIKQL